MIRFRSCCNSRNGMSKGGSVGLFLSSLIFIMVSAAASAAETKNVRIMLDWIIQGTHAPFFIAQEKGYYKAEGVTAEAIDAGRGATNVAVTVAGGAYHFGWVDMPSLVRFNAQNPAAPLLAVYVSFDETPLAVITRSAANIRKPADLEGKKIAGGPGTAVHDTISILLKAANVPNVKINWVAVQPQLFGPMLRRGEVDGTGGFTNSNIPAALELGFTMDDLFVLKYSDFGADMYGLALVTTKKFADDNPETVRGVVKALNRGTKDTIASPQKALELLKGAGPNDEAGHREGAARHRAGPDQHGARPKERAELGHPRKAEGDDRRGRCRISTDDEVRLPRRSTPTRDSFPRSLTGCRRGGN